MTTMNTMITSAEPKIIEKTIRLEDLELDPSMLADFITGIEPSSPETIAPETIAHSEVSNSETSGSSQNMRPEQPEMISTTSTVAQNIPITELLKQKIDRVREITVMSGKMGTSLEMTRRLLDLPAEVVMDFSSAVRGNHATVAELCQVLSMFYGITLNDVQFSAMLVHLDPEEKQRRKKEKRARRKLTLKNRKLVTTEEKIDS